MRLAFVGETEQGSHVPAALSTSSWRMGCPGWESADLFVASSGGDMRTGSIRNLAKPEPSHPKRKQQLSRTKECQPCSGATATDLWWVGIGISVLVVTLGLPILSLFCIFFDGYSLTSIILSGDTFSPHSGLWATMPRGPTTLRGQIRCFASRQRWASHAPSSSSPDFTDIGGKFLV